MPPEEKTLHVLAVEDDPLLRDLLAHKISKNNWHIISAHNGETGLRLAKECAPDIILLDILLPGMSGHEVLEKLKQDPATAHIPVLMLSNFGEQDQIEKSMALGATDHLVKAHVILDEVLGRVAEITQK